MPQSLAVVTGPTAGIGRVFADRLARRGHALLLISRDETRLASLAADLTRTYGVEARILAADLSREDDIERVATALEAETDIGVLVNNAGFGTSQFIHASDLAPQMQMLRLHVLAPMRLSHAVLPGMVMRERGWLINVSSVATFINVAGSANYGATKVYLTRFTQAMDLELEGTGVRVQALCPGFTHTEFHDRAKLDMGERPSWLWLNANDVVDGSLAAIERGKGPVYIPGLRYRLLVPLLRMLPHALSKRLQRRRRRR